MTRAMKGHKVAKQVKEEDALYEFASKKDKGSPESAERIIKQKQPRMVVSERKPLTQIKSDSLVHD